MEYFSIDGFPDYRLVRESERDFYVESCKKGEWKKIGYDNGDGHIHVTLFNDKYKRSTCLHVIVAETFIPNPDGKTVVHHIDGDATNNDPANNLMWVTSSQHKAIHNKLDNPMRSEAARKKISESMKGHIISEETRKKISVTLKGKQHPMYGKHPSEESRRKMSESHKGKPKPEGSGKPPRVVEQLSLDGKHIEYYESTNDASRKTGANQSHISSCCRGKRNYTGGYKWRYAD